MNTGRKIRELRTSKEINWSVDEFVSRLSNSGIKACKSWVEQIENGKAFPTHEQIRIIANIFKKTPEYFTNSKTELNDLYTPYTAYSQTNSEYISVIGSITGESFYFSLDATPSGLVPLRVEQTQERKIFALKVRCESLKPFADLDELIIFSQEEFVDNDELALVQIDDSFIIKRIYRKEESIELHSEFSKSAKIVLPKKSTKIIAKVLGVFRTIKV
jgi:SOS-response transcriptional repressor LexA